MCWGGNKKMKWQWKEDHSDQKSMRKCIQNRANCQMAIYANLGNEVDQIYIQLSLELNVMERNWFCVEKQEANQIEFRHKIGTGSSLDSLPAILKLGSDLCHQWCPCHRYSQPTGTGQWTHQGRKGKYKTYTVKCWHSKIATAGGVIDMFYG